LRALRVSCNIYYYDTGRRLGIDKLAAYAGQFGIGRPTGIEIGEDIGQMSSRELRESAGRQWYAGDVMQAAIGQGDTLITPLQMASYMATLANDGVRKEMRLIKSVKTYDLDETIKEAGMVVMETMNVPKEVFETVKDGMVQASRIGTAAAYFGNYPIDVASKTGTPQTSGLPNSVFVCFAPAYDPEIAVVIVIEKGWHGYTGAPVAKAILDAYFFGDEKSDVIPGINELL
jgi:penicillin-binding protein 2